MNNDVSKGLTLFFIILMNTSLFCSIQVTIIRPTQNQLTDDSLNVAVSITSTYEIVSVTASIETKTINLTYQSGLMTGDLFLTGLTRGTKVLYVTARDYFGDSVIASIIVNYDKKPVLHVEKPEKEYTLLTQGIHIKAYVTDDNPDFNNSLQVYVNDNLVVDTKNQIDTTLIISNPGVNTVVIQCMDSENQAVENIYYAVYVVNNSRLVLYKELEYPILSMTDSLALCQHIISSSENEYYLYGLKDNTKTRINLPRFSTVSNSYFYKNMLFVEVYDYNYTFDSLFILNETGLKSLYSITHSYHYKNYIAWSTGSILYSRNILNDTLYTISVNAGNTDNSIGENGVVAFWDNNYNINLYENNKTTYVGPGVYPKTDGHSVIYRNFNQTNISLYRNGTNTLIVSAIGPYEINNGWIAYSKTGLTGTMNVFLQNAEGFEKQISFYGSNTQIKNISENGKVIVYNNNGIYYADMYDLPVLFSEDNNGTVFWKGDSLFYSLYNGIFLINQGPVGVQNEDATLYSYALRQNYPNPFNPVTIISYSINKNNKYVLLKVYDILGKEVATLINEVKQQGNYKVEFNAGKLNLSSGIYLYRLITDNFVSTRKMIYIK